MGVCPQFDILWPQLTVEEHLYFYTRLRGTKASKEDETVEKALEIAGNKHKYQKIVIVFICIVWALNSFLVLGPSFYYMDPIFKCGTQEGTFD